MHHNKEATQIAVHTLIAIPFQGAGEGCAASASRPSVGQQSLWDFPVCVPCTSQSETALLDVTNCLLSNADEGRVSILTLLDLSAAFDAFDYSILLAYLHDMFGISGMAFEWFSSYLSDRFQSVSVNGRVSSQKKLRHGVPQGSILGPVLFTAYTQPLSDIISQRKCNHHKFADDTQLHKSSTPSDFHSLIPDIEQCVDSIGSWMTGHRLTLNNDKTEALVVWSRRRGSVSQDSHLRVGSHDISFKSHSKASGFTLTLPCLWQCILTTLVVQHILRSEELALFAISRRERPLFSWCVPLFSVVWTIATLYSLTPFLIKCTAFKKIKIMQPKSFFA